MHHHTQPFPAPVGVGVSKILKKETKWKSKIGIKNLNYNTGGISYSEW
jgi:hypothetical protein